MKKHTFPMMVVALLASLSLCSQTAWSKPVIERVEPLSWWTEMKCPLRLMVYGQDLSDAQVKIERRQGRGYVATDGLKLTGQHNAESKNYLFIDLDVREQGRYRITLTKNQKKTSFEYQIQARREGSRERKGFNTSDVVYLLMSDRFHDGDPSNNSVKSMLEKGNKANVDGRWGGDIYGIIKQFDHIKELGATTIWPTPLLEDNEAAWSYHGYACSDYYHIDPRYGDNELYRQMVGSAHASGLKIVMDMVPNHCGAAHWWMKDLPYKNWVNQFPEFTSTPNVFSANYDINASEYDREMSNSGWFDTPMPDMNLRNEDVLRYFTQWAIWWVEYADLDGLRVDTYPYIDKVAGSRWLEGIRNEYPQMNIVGECWTRPTPAVAYWQSGTKNFDGFDSHLPCVMDFPLEEAIRQALENDGKYWGGGLTKVYDVLSMDYLYGDVNNLLIFAGNHDMDRIADVVMNHDPRRVKIAMALIATMRGIPQLFAGDEYGMRSSDMSRGHSTLRRPLPDRDTLTAAEKDMFAFQSKLFRYRLSEPIIHNGKTMHFISRDNTYAFFRYTDEGAVFVFANAADEARTIPTAHYKEMLDRYEPIGKEILTEKAIDMSRDDIVVEPLSVQIVRIFAK